MEPWIKMFEKKCTLCENVFEVKEIEEFTKYFHRSREKGKYGFKAFCKECIKKENYKQREKRRQKTIEKRIAKAPIKRCVVCSKDFKSFSGNLTCSEECKKIKLRIKQRIRRKINLEKNIIKKREEEKRATRRNKRFTEYEKKYILKIINNGGKYKDIAEALQRTEKSIIQKVSYSKLKAKI